MGEGVVVVNGGNNCKWEFGIHSGVVESLYLIDGVDSSGQAGIGYAIFSLKKNN